VADGEKQSNTYANTAFYLFFGGRDAEGDWLSGTSVKTCRSRFNDLSKRLRTAASDFPSNSAISATGSSR
jgi:hypothetical protein